MGLHKSTNATRLKTSTRLPIVISTDPPYYDNIAYSILSDFFYVWQRKGTFRPMANIIPTAHDSQGR